MILKIYNSLFLIISIIIGSVLNLNARQHSNSFSDTINNYDVLEFRSIGPAFMSGRIADIAIDPTNENDFVHNIQYINFLENDDEYSYGIGKPEGSYVSLLVIRNYVYLEDYSDGQNGSSKYDGYYEELAFKPVLVW